MTTEEREAFLKTQEDTLRISKPMEPNTTYMRLKYLFYTTIHDDSGWGKHRTFCLFKDAIGRILRTKKIKTLSYREPPDFSDLTIDEMLASNRKGKYHLACGKEYDIITGPDGSAMEVYGNGMSVIRKGNKIEAHKI